MAIHFNFILSDNEAESLSGTLHDAQVYYLMRAQKWIIKYAKTNDPQDQRMVDYLNKCAEEAKKLSSIMFEDSSRI